MYADLADPALWPPHGGCDDEPAMDMGRGMRTGRAAVFAAVCVLLASLGHVLMSGTTVPGWSLAAAFGAVGVTAWWLADRERGPMLVTSLTVGTQAVLHALFSLGQAATGSRPPDGSGLAAQWAELLLCGPHPASPAEAAQLMAAAGLGQSPPGDGLTVQMTDMPGMGTGMGTGMDMGAGMEMGTHAHHAAAALAMPSHHGGGTVGMLAAHLLAALLLGAWLSAGERAVFRLGRTATARLFAPLLLLLRLACPPLRPRLRLVRADSARRLRQLLLVHTITSRGPPAGAAAV
ncbi:hypothetical protein GCM10010193_53070 [Kitasatospora atroaurantiaca]